MQNKPTKQNTKKNQKKKKKKKREKKEKNRFAFATKKQNNEDYRVFSWCDERRIYIEDVCGLVYLHKIIQTHRRQWLYKSTRIEF